MLLWAILGVSLTSLVFSAVCLWKADHTQQTIRLDREDLFETARQVDRDQRAVRALIKQHEADVALFKAQRNGIPAIAIHRPEANGQA